MASEMRISVVYNDSRISIDVDSFHRVKDVKEIVREHFHIGPDEGPAGAEFQEKKILTLSYAGANLNDTHWLADLGITPGSTVKAILREEVKPSLFFYTAFNGKTIPVVDKISFKSMTIVEFRGLASRKTGLPVGAFRMLNNPNQELFDGATVDDYDIDIGSTIDIQTWDGWNELLNLCMLGFASQAMTHLSNNELVARFQQKVMLYMAAHFNHIDLAVSLLRNGLRADEAVGEHPSRQWCKDTIRHIDSMKSPVHEASEAGSLGVLRAFVHNNVMNVLAKDGNDLTPLNIALRKKQKPCASFLLTKQWSKINYTKKHAIPLSIYVKIRRWSDRSKDRAFVLHGAWKSSLKNPKRFITNGALVGLEVQVDGFSRSKMTSKSEALARFDVEQDVIHKQKVFDFSDDSLADMDPEQYFKSLSNITNIRLPRIGKMGKMIARQASQSDVKTDKAIPREVGIPAADIAEEIVDDVGDVTDAGEDASGGENSSPDMKRKNAMSRSESQNLDERADARSVRFPPITQHQRIIKSQSVYNMATHDDSDLQSRVDNARTKGMFIKTGTKAPSVKTARTMPTPAPNRRSLTQNSRYDVQSQITRDDDSGGGGGGDTSRRDKDTQEAQAQRKRKRDRISQSDAVLAKARSETHNIALPVQSFDSNPRPFVNPRCREIHETLRLYEQQRGMTSRDYAIQCLSVANTFKEKPWLAQVHQAMTIAQKGVKKTMNRCPHIFKVTGRPISTAKSQRGFNDAESETTHRTFMTA